MINFFSKKYGGHRDLPDARDLRYEEIAGAPISVLPKKIRLPLGQKIKNQGRTSSCGVQASSLASGIQLLNQLSARYAFKIIKNDPAYPSSKLPWGQYTRDAAKIAVAGICLESLAPEKNIHSDKAYLNFDIDSVMSLSASKNRADAYVRVDNQFGNDFNLVKRFIWEQKRPVIVAMPWYKSYNKAKKTGVLPSPEGSSLGHIVVCIGWDNDDYIMVNSFGDQWGTDGTFKMNKMLQTYDCWGIIKKDLVFIPGEKIIRRDIELEKKKAFGMQKFLYWKFATYDRARGVAGKEWLLIVQAITYRGYSYVDVVNYCYAKSRGLKVPFDLEEVR